MSSSSLAPCVGFTPAIFPGSIRARPARYLADPALKMVVLRAAVLFASAPAMLRVLPSVEVEACEKMRAHAAPEAAICGERE